MLHFDYVDSEVAIAICVALCVCQVCTVQVFFYVLVLHYVYCIVALCQCVLHCVALCCVLCCISLPLFANLIL